MSDQAQVFPASVSGPLLDFPFGPQDGGCRVDLFLTPMNQPRAEMLAEVQ
jgi:hypothetical protein